jgi:hypothetical protein
MSGRILHDSNYLGKARATAPSQGTVAAVFPSGLHRVDTLLQRRGEARKIALTAQSKAAERRGRRVTGLRRRSAMLAGPPVKRRKRRHRRPLALTPLIA